MATIKGLTVAIGADTKQFNKEMRATDRSIKNTSKEVDALTESLNLEFDAGRFEEAMRLAESVIAQTEEKAKALRGQLEYLEKSGGADTESYQKLQTELIKTESQAVKLKNKLDEIKDLKIEKLVNQFKSVGDGITKTGQALVPFSAAAAAALASFTAIAKSTIDTGGALDDMAQQVNINAEALQKWQYVAAQSGLDNQQLQNAFIKTQTALADFATGVEGPGSKALERLGIATADAAKGMDANLENIIQQLAAIEDPINKAAIANEIFGDRLGAKLIPLLNNGGEGIAQLTAEFENFGYMSNEQVSQLASLGDVIQRITSTFGALKNEIGVALIPLMETLAGIVETKIIPAIRTLVDWFTGLSDKTKETIATVLLVVAALAPVLLIVGKLTSGIGGVIKAVQGVSQALSFLAAHPIITVIILIIRLFMLLYNTNETFRNSINALVSQLGESLMPILNTLMDALGAIFEAFMPIINILGNVLGTVISALTPIIMMLVNILSKTLIPIIELVANIFVKAFGFVQKVIEGYVKIIEKIINGIIDFINLLIRQINKLGDVLGFTVGELKRVEMTGKITTDNQKQETFTAKDTPEKAITNANVTDVPRTVINNDYSDKDISINVTVQNYAAEVDTDKLVRDINIKLAEAM